MSSSEMSNVTQTKPSPSDYFVLGTRVDAVQIPGVIAQMQDWIARRDACRYIAVTGMHGVTEAKYDPQLRAALASASLVVPDGMPLVWLGRQDRRALPPRGAATALAHKFARQFPDHQIAGPFTPPYRNLTPNEDQEICSVINDSKSDVVWVGLGTPKQEHWMRDRQDRLAAPVLIGVGAAFDFHTGRVRNAPAWMGDHGLEWLFRLAQEPRRLWRRYLLRGAEFTALAILELLKQK